MRLYLNFQTFRKILITLWLACMIAADILLIKGSIFRSDEYLIGPQKIFRKQKYECLHSISETDIRAFVQSTNTFLLKWFLILIPLWEKSKLSMFVFYEIRRMWLRFFMNKQTIESPFILRTQLRDPQLTQNYDHFQ